MVERRVRVREVPEDAVTEKARCGNCRAVFDVERGRQFAMSCETPRGMNAAGAAGTHGKMM